MCPASAALEAKVKEWLKWDKNPKTREEIEHMVKAKKTNELSKIMLHRINFGTAGLRGKMAAGYSCMNDLVIIQTGQGFLHHLQTTDGQKLKEKGIVLGYDGRHNSKRWAELTASIFLQADIPVHLFSAVVPTPFVPFAVNLFEAAAGVMITASHNPKDDNGYKVYGSNGAQITSPADKQIQQSILNNLEPKDSHWKTDCINKADDPLKKVLEKYLDVIDNALLEDHKKTNAATPLKFTYTAMHGVGYNYIVKVFERANLKVIPVEKQKNPDPDFPTVKFPNPEEGKSALDLAIKTANEQDSTIIIANDPDADRLAVAEKDKKGNWKIFNGNELGSLLAYWTWHCQQEKYPKEKPENVYMLSSTVSSKICRTMSEAEGFQFLETLTGFKWMGNKAVELMEQKKKVIFAFEEAIGYMIGTGVLDKDGVSAAVHLATMACHLNKYGLTLIEQLHEIYKQYGFHVSLNSYFICHDPVTIKKIFDRLRNFSEENSYPKSIGDGKYPIETVRDLTTGYDSSQKDRKAILPTSSSSQMITFVFCNGLTCTLRTSGTEPKIKYYTELISDSDRSDQQNVKILLKEMVDAIIEEFLQPVVNKLTPQAE